ncbi:flagellar export chaperone FliS [Thalassotalea sp. 1_MG-2023]|uniref:flagellar export chaperone FliS n=1 Tax=Thalassotalea sp. 1_MG-2023 TaxID=3062680 RepID=UPI0026E2DA64|nr:flagellar export chaperone FliS [Thalassotalea sp. 1_MG-2023]MDO6426446.1 flagellar export chaperone FliS [Thalassotalea sp. 1_MG-2023]
MRKNLSAYKQVDINSNILASDPHQIILLMFDGLLKGIATARGAIERKDFELKAQSLTKSINILDALIQSLDFDSQPEISKNFEVMYSYCIDCLMEASTSLNVAKLDEVVDMIKPVRSAWSEMPEDAKQEGLDKLKQKNDDTTAAVGA